MDASTAFKKLRDEALCELVPLKTFGGVAAMLRQLLKVTAKQLTAEAIRSYVEAAAIYCEARAEVTVNDMESIKAATSDTQEAAKTAQRVAQEATVLLQTTTAEAQALKLQLESLAKEVQGFTQGSKDIIGRPSFTAREDGEIDADTIHYPTADTFPTFTPSSTTTKTYAAATAQSVAAHLLRPTHAPTIARGDGTAKQLVLRLDTKAGEVDLLASLSDKEVVDKARMALDSTAGIGERPLNMSFAIARRQQNGTKVLLQLNTAEAAQWLRQTAVLREFQDHFGGSCLIKPSVFEIIVEYAPVSLDLDNGSLFRHIEQDCVLDDQDIVGGRWLRKPERRAEGQKKAFLAIGCKSRESANRLIKDGCIIEGQLLNARKPRPEPLRCAKCQRLNCKHVARTCTSPHDICARCSGQHRTTECANKSSENLRCANCRGPHAASDRSCEVFQEQLKRMREQQPDSAYVFYPTNEPWTWAKEQEPEVMVHHTKTRDDLRQHHSTTMPPRHHGQHKETPFFASSANRVPVGRRPPRTQTQLTSWMAHNETFNVPSGLPQADLNEPTLGPSLTTPHF